MSTQNTLSTHNEARREVYNFVSGSSQVDHIQTKQTHYTTILHHTNTQTFSTYTSKTYDQDKMSPFRNFRTAYKIATKMSKEQKEAQRFKHDFATTKRAESSLSPELREDHEYPHLIQATYGEDMADGIYVCCCGTENNLYHFEGKYPFKDIRCRKCNRIFDDECSSTTIMTPIKDRTGLPSSGLTQQLAEGMCQICPACGLTHRVGLVPGSTEPNYDVTCHCGIQSNRFWNMFYICSPKAYRNDPHAESVRLKAEWCSKATQKALNQRALDTQTQSAPPSLAVPKPARSTVSKAQAAASRPSLPTRPHTSVGQAVPVTAPELSLPASPATPLKRNPAVRGRRVTENQSRWV